MKIDDERKKMIIDILKEEVLKVSEASRKKMLEDYCAYRQEYDSQIFDSLDYLRKQAEEIQKSVSYICLFFLQSSVFTESYDFLLAFYNQDFYQDRKPIYRFVKCDYIAKIIQCDFEIVKKRLQDKIIRVTKWEIDYAKRIFASIYFMNVYGFFAGQMTSLSAEDYYQDKAIMYGEYMGPLHAVDIKKLKQAVDERKS